jgi:Xaa-Pro aminopeptidase
MNDRVKALRDVMKRKRLDALLIEDLAQTQYLLEVYRTIAPGEARGITLVEPDALTFLADPLSVHRLAQHLPPEVAVVEADGNAFVRRGYRFTKELTRLIRKRGVRKLGALGQRYKEALGATVKLRLLKENPLLDLAETRTEHEIGLLERAAAIADAVCEQVIAELQPGLTEIGLRARIDELLYENGADVPAFGTLVSSGENTNQIHAVSTNRQLQRGDLVMLDFGAKVNGMGSDLTRTFVFGKASPEQRKLWQAVAEAQRLALERLRAGKQGKTVAAAARNHLVKAGYGDFYCHSLGHQLGILCGATHLSIGCQRRLREGMVLTVEPGAYTPRGGARIEDDVVVTRDGCRLLTHAPKPMEVDA